MVAFEDIRPGSRLRGLDPGGVAEIVQVARFGPDALNLVFRVNGRVGERLVYRGEEGSFASMEAGRSYAFDADGGLLRLASEAYRIRLAYLFDPYLAVTASQIEALPHQITAVYGEMLPRQPLRFLLADDPGAGKTIMAGLLIKELLIRGDLERCLIVAPGSLVEQWQEEMAEKFGLGFRHSDARSDRGFHHRQSVRREEPPDRPPRHGGAFGRIEGQVAKPRRTGTSSSATKPIEWLRPISAAK